MVGHPARLTSLPVGQHNNSAGSNRSPQRRQRTRKSVGQGTTAAPMKRIGRYIAGQAVPGGHVSARASRKLQEEYRASVQEKTSIKLCCFWRVP
jgi:hypothetical protein